MNHEIADHFKRYFTVGLAISEAEKAEVYRLRYRVYCDEFGFEPKDRFPDQQEVDHYDALSIHCLVRHIGTGNVAGCVRMVPATYNGERIQLPMEQSGLIELDPECATNLWQAPDSVFECSRLAVDYQFRRRRQEGLPDAKYNFSSDERRAMPLIGIAAFFAAAAIGESNQRDNLFAMVEPFLPRMLRRSGVALHPVGPMIDYHGRRAPHFIAIKRAVEMLNPKYRALYDYIYDAVNRDELRTFA